MSSSLTSTVGGDAGEQRPRAWVGQRRGGDAADLQPGRDVGQHLVLGRRVLRGHAACRGLGGDHPFGHDQLGQPATQLPALAGARYRQRSGQRAAAQPRFAGVDLVDRHRDDRPRLQRRFIAPSPSPRASRPVGRRNRPGPAPTTGRAPPRPAGPRRSRARRCRGPAAPRPASAGPIHSQVPHGLIRCASRLRSAPASVPTVTASRAESPAATSTSAGSLDQIHQPAVVDTADRDHADVFDDLTPRPSGGRCR